MRNSDLRREQKLFFHIRAYQDYQYQPYISWVTTRHSIFCHRCLIHGNIRTVVLHKYNEKVEMTNICMGFFPWEVGVAFPGESQLWQSHATQPTMHARSFQHFHNPLNSDMDYRIFYVHTDVNACDCTWGCVDIGRVSAQKVESER